MGLTNSYPRLRFLFADDRRARVAAPPAFNFWKTGQAATPPKQLSAKEQAVQRAKTNYMVNFRREEAAVTNKYGKKTDSTSDSSSGSGSGNSGPQPGPALDYKNKPFEYNVGAVRDAYFSKAVSFHKLLTPGSTVAVNDNPTTIASPDELWKGAGKNKGMISLFLPATAGNMDAVVPDTDKSQLQPAEYAKYGFQFHYNPTSIGMNYAGSPNTDVSMEVSGNEGFNLVGANVNQSTITFQIVINRVADMKYYELVGGKGRLKANLDDKLYSPRKPTLAEQDQIYRKGTMYDIEYLLSTVIGYRLNTKYRGMTADVGWISGRPVQLYLGQSLRYLGFINSFAINHTIFNERMVPVFTTAELSFNRIPDYAGI